MQEGAKEVPDRGGGGTAIGRYVDRALAKAQNGAGQPGGPEHDLGPLRPGPPVGAHGRDAECPGGRYGKGIEFGGRLAEADFACRWASPCFGCQTAKSTSAARSSVAGFSEDR
jgi:hypothetical protein